MTREIIAILAFIAIPTRSFSNVRRPTFTLKTDNNWSISSSIHPSLLHRVRWGGGREAPPTKCTPTGSTTSIQHDPSSDRMESSHSQSPPIVYTIAGSDSGGGAGIQADLHAIHAMGCYGCSAITCLTAQNSVKVSAIHTPPASFLQQQLETLYCDIPPNAIKIGMLGSAELAHTVGAFLESVKENTRMGRVWVVLDPVMISTSGSRLIEKDAQQAMVDRVFPYTDIVTPNKFEAEALLGRTIDTMADTEQAARDILQMGVSAVLIKGGHALTDTNFALDYFLSSKSKYDGDEAEPRLCDGYRGVWLKSTRFDTLHTHGTGCTLSSSIAAALAIGEKERQRQERSGALSSITLVDACCLAKAYVTAGIAKGIALGHGPGPVVQTEFPCSHQHYPSILVANQDKMKTQFLGLTAHSSVGRDLGCILPIVDSVEWVERLCGIEGITDIQLRIKGVSDEHVIIDIVAACQRLCAATNVRLWVNDHWKAAIDAGCFGVHLGQEDLLRCVESGGLDLLRSNCISLGVSTHSFGELAVALDVQPAYISLGPVFGTRSKTVRFDPQGLAAVGKWRQLIPYDVPLVAIGGIQNTTTVGAVRMAGADCIAVIGAVTQAPDSSGAVAALIHAMQGREANVFRERSCSTFTHF